MSASSGDHESLRIARSRAGARKRTERRLGLLLCAPAAIVMLLVVGYPLLYAGYLSLFRADLGTPEANTFVGLRNYVTVLGSPIWWRAFGLTMFVTVVGAALEMVLGTLLAVVMHRTLVGRGLVRTAVLMPYAVVSVVAAFSWRFAFTPGVGWLVGDSAPLSQRWPAIGIIVLAEVWKSVPFVALVLMAALTLVPQELTRAAAIDGATAWQRFWQITVPLIKPAIVLVVVFRVLDAFRIFESIFVLTGGVDGTASVSLLAYDNLVKGLDLGIGSTMAVLILITSAVLALSVLKLVDALLPGSGRDE